MGKKVLVTLFVSFLFLNFSKVVNASSVVPVGLDVMTAKAGHVFHGTCLDVKTFTDESGILSTEVRYEILRSVKGPGSKIITFKVFGLAQGETQDGNSTVVGMTGFYPGREDVLFLYKESPLGFTSPVGLWQGSFPVTRESGEARLIRSERSHRFVTGAKAARSSGGMIVTPDDLLDEVERILLSPDANSGQK